MLKAILFDLDGTLVDSERIGLDVSMSVLETAGVQLSENDKRLFLGIQDRDFYRIIGQRHCIDDVKVGKLINQHADEYSKRLQKGLPLYNGAIELLKFCNEQGLNVTIVTGSLQEEVDAIFSQHGLENLIKYTVAAQDVMNGKPDPEGYITALHLQGCLAKDALVVEDSVAGIVAGRRADIQTIKVEHTTDKSSLTHYHCNSLQTVQCIITQLLP